MQILNLKHDNAVFSLMKWSLLTFCYFDFRIQSFVQTVHCIHLLSNMTNKWISVRINIHIIAVSSRNLLLPVILTIFF